jgi:tRNA-dihydrouridine synthase A
MRASIAEARHRAPDFSWMLDRKFSVAPMMGRTDRHCRYFLRGFSPRLLLYTEMITASELVHGAAERLLAFDPEEHPLALQLGGCDPRELAAAARIGEGAGYDEINLNCGCPSDRTTGRLFGAYLMQQPQTILACVAAMRAAVRVPVTVKLRIGVIEGRGRAAIEAARRFDETERAALHGLVAGIRDAGCEAVIVHARKAVLGGLSAQDNREIPPLRYQAVRELKQAFPHLQVILNGGLREPQAILEALANLDGVMLGREAYHRPLILAHLESLSAHGAGIAVRHCATVTDLEADARGRAIGRMQRYAERQLARGENMLAVVRHMQGLYAGELGAAEFRRVLNEGARRPGAGPQLLAQAAASAERRAAADALAVS